MSARSRRLAVAVARLDLAFVLVVVAALAVAFHRSGHTEGDDFALYLRQARSIFDGDPGAVIADNRFSVINSDSGFSPIGYPWGWPLILSPFVRFWGLDYDRLKLIEVGLLCIWLAFVHGIVRRRLGSVAAIVVVAVLGTAPEFLAHTEQLLTEIPHLVAVGVFLWWLDRVQARTKLTAASWPDLISLGVLAAVVFNVRREGIVLPVVIAGVQAYDIWQTRQPGKLWPRLVEHWRVLVAPHAAFVAGVVFFQLLLPTALLPDNGNSRSNIPDRWGEFPEILSTQLGLGERTWVGLIVLALAAVGVVVGLVRRPRLDLPILVLALFSALTIGTHFRRVDRYWFQVTPWVLYFALAACVAGAAAVWAHRERAALLVGVAPVAILLVAHAMVLPGKINTISEFNDAGRVLSGPSNPDNAPIYEAVQRLTPPDAVVAYYRARTMTLLTDRRSFQTKSLEAITLGADYFAQRRRASAWQPDVEDMTTSGFEEVWADDKWILWRVPEQGVT